MPNCPLQTCETSRDVKRNDALGVTDREKREVSELLHNFASMLTNKSGLTEFSLKLMEIKPIQLKL